MLMQETNRLNNLLYIIYSENPARAYQLSQQNGKTSQKLPQKFGMEFIQYHYAQLLIHNHEWKISYIYFEIVTWFKMVGLLLSNFYLMICGIILLFNAKEITFWGIQQLQ